MADKLVTIAEFPTNADAEAHLAKMQLESHGIKAIIVGENLLVASPYCGYKAIELQVLESQAQQAVEILEYNGKQEQ